jgi:hypothetical protein
VGGRLAAAANTPFEREITLTFKVGEKTFALKLDMTGNKPVLLIVGSDAKIKVASGELRGGQRPGALYEPPPRPKLRVTPEEVDRELLERRLGQGEKLKSFLLGVPGYLLENLEGRSVEVAARGLRALVKVREEGFALSHNGGRLLCDVQREQDDDEALRTAGGWLAGLPGNSAGGLNADGGGPGAASEKVSEKAPEKALEKAETRWRKKLQRRIKNIQRDIAQLPDAKVVERLADTLAAGLGRARKGMDCVEVEDLHREGEMLSIPLDPSRTPGDNLNRLYKKAKKIHRAAKVASERLGETQKELEAGPPPQLAELAQGSARGRQSGQGGVRARSGGGGGKAGGKAETLPYRRYRSSDGWLLLVGRNSVENDRLVREAKGWDLWLHARDGAGAHVIVKKPGKDSKVLQRTLAEAAGLAALHSKRSDETAVEVMYVEAERVKKPKGASPGRVLVSGEQTLRIAPGAGNPKEV